MLAKWSWCTDCYAKYHSAAPAIEGLRYGLLPKFNVFLLNLIPHWRSEKCVGRSSAVLTVKERKKEKVQVLQILSKTNFSLC